MTFRDGVSIVYRRKLVAIGFFVCVVASGFVVLTIVPPVYRATAQVMLHLGQEDVFMPTLASSSSEVRTPLSVGGLEQRTNSEIRIIESEALAAQLMSRFGAARLFPGINVQYSWFTPEGADPAGGRSLSPNRCLLLSRICRPKCRRTRTETAA